MSEDNKLPDAAPSQPETTTPEGDPVVPKPPECDEILTGEVVDEYNNNLARKVATLSDDLWRKIQLAGGVIMGLAAGACLFFIKSDPKSFLPLNFLLALFIALAVPNIAEKQLQRKVGVGRTALLIAFAAVILGYTIYGLATGTFNS